MSKYKEQVGEYFVCPYCGNTTQELNIDDMKKVKFVGAYKEYITGIKSCESCLKNVAIDYELGNKVISSPNCEINSRKHLFSNGKCDLCGKRKAVSVKELLKEWENGERPKKDFKGFICTNSGCKKF